MRSIVLLALAPLAMGFAPAFSPAFAAGSVRPQVAVAKAPAFAALRSQRSAVGALQMGKGIDFPQVVSKLKSGARKTLLDLGIKEDDIVEFEVPGAWELPLASRYMAMTQKVDAIIPMGVLIKGETDHYDMIKDAATSGLMDLQLTTGIPVLCGILGCHDMAQADARATGDFNHGVWWAKTAVEMAALRNLQMGKSGKARKSVGFTMSAEDFAAASPGSKDEKKKVGGFF